jgi:hypothetical protein
MLSAYFLLGFRNSVNRFKQKAPVHIYLIQSSRPAYLMLSEFTNLRKKHEILHLLFLNMVVSFHSYKCKFSNGLLHQN